MLVEGIRRETARNLLVECNRVSNELKTLPQRISSGRARLDRCELVFTVIVREARLANFEPIGMQPDEREKNFARNSFERAK